jgi:hypothetical protein
LHTEIWSDANCGPPGPVPRVQVHHWVAAVARGSLNAHSVMGVAPRRGSALLLVAQTPSIIDLTGAHWGVDGAEAVLKPRALFDNGDFESYWHPHLAREHEDLYLTPDQHGYELMA